MTATSTTDRSASPRAQSWRRTGRPSPSLAGKVVVLTGASSGNGRAAARAFAQEGAWLVLAARREAVLEEVAAECLALGGEALVAPTDVAEPHAVELLAAAAIARFGRIDIWVNDAGVLQYGRFDETPTDVIEQVIHTNLLGCMYGSRVALQHFRARGQGTLINMGSILGRFGHPYTAAYVASKFAILGLTESLREEVADQPGVHVCAVLPAAIDTPIYERAANYTGRKIRPIWVLYPPEVVARAIVSLAKRPRREAYAGFYGRVAVLGRRIAPGFSEWLLRASADLMEIGKGGVAPTDGNLRVPLSDGHATRGGWRLRYGLQSGAAAFAGAALVIGLFAAGRSRRP
jgi:short-subunit dehydrogenase